MIVNCHVIDSLCYVVIINNGHWAIVIVSQAQAVPKHDLLFYFNPQHARILNDAIIDVRSSYRHLATVLVRDGENTDNCVTILPAKIQYDGICLRN